MHVFGIFALSLLQKSTTFKISFDFFLVQHNAPNFAEVNWSESIKYIKAPIVFFLNSLNCKRRRAVVGAVL